MTALTHPTARPIHDMALPHHDRWTGETAARWITIVCSAAWIAFGFVVGQL